MLFFGWGLRPENALPGGCNEWVSCWNDMPGDSKWPTFHPLVGRHLTPEKGHLTIPKTSLWITRWRFFEYVLLLKTRVLQLYTFLKEQMGFERRHLDMWWVAMAWGKYGKHAPCMNSWRFSQKKSKKHVMFHILTKEFLSDHRAPTSGGFYEEILKIRIEKTTHVQLHYISTLRYDIHT